MGSSIPGVLIFIALSTLSLSLVSSSVLYPWGGQSGDFEVPLPSDPEGTKQYDLNYKVNLTMGLGFKYVGKVSNFVILNKQGFIHFKEDYKTSPNPLYVSISKFATQFGTTYGPAILPFLSEIDPLLGSIHYRETTDKPILQKAMKDIKTAFPSLKDLNVDWALVITWVDLRFWEPLYYHDVNTSCNCPLRTNTFQAVLATTLRGQRSFVIFNYDKINWIRNPWSYWEGGNHLTCPLEVVQSPQSVTSLPGFTGVPDPFYLPLPGILLNNGEDTVMNLTENTNLLENGVKGRWVYKVDDETGIDSTTCDLKEGQIEQVKVYPESVCHLGQVPLRVRGPCLIGATNIECRFYEGGPNSVLQPQITIATVSSNDEAVCMAPLLYTMQGSVRVELAFTYHPPGTETKEDKRYNGTLYTYPPPPSRGWGTSLDLRISLNGEVQFSWNPAFFQLEKEKLVQLTFFVLDMSKSNPVEQTPLKMSTFNTGSFSWGLGSTGIFAKRPKSAFFAYMTTLEPEGDKYLYSQVTYASITGGREEFKALCEEWARIDPGVPTNISACPPLQSQAEFDWTFYQEPQAPTVPPTYTYRQSLPTRGSCQRCRYGDTGRLIYGAPAGATAYLKCPSDQNNFLDHQIKDIMPMHWCLFGESLHLYYGKRNSRTSSGVGYEPPSISSWRGDPHITTWDNVTYTFNPVGEFWMIRKSSTPNFQAQARMSRYLKTTGSIFTGLAIQQETPSIEVQITLWNATARLWVNKKEVEMDGIPSIEEDGGPTLRMNMPGAYIAIWRRKDASDLQRVVLWFSTGFMFDVSILESETGQFLNIMAGISKELKGSGKLTGLLGDFDGNATNDLMEGMIKLPRNATLMAVNRWGQQFRTTEAETLFMYMGGETFADFEDTAFIPTLRYPNITQMPRRAQEICESLMECYFDFNITGSPMIASATKDADIKLARIREILERKPPVCLQPNCSDVTDFTYPTMKPSTPGHGNTTGPTKKPSSATTMELSIILAMITITLTMALASFVPLN